MISAVGIIAGSKASRILERTVKNNEIENVTVGDVGIIAGSKASRVSENSNDEKLCRKCNGR